MRLTRIGTMGVPVTGSCGMAVSTGWVTVSMTDDVDAPDEFTIRVGAASSCLPTRVRPKLNWINVGIDFCEVDPEIMNLITGAAVISDTDGDSVGWATDTATYADGSFALELWTGITGSTGCDETGIPRYGYLLLPWLLGGIHGDVTHERGTTSFRMKATTQVGNQWGVGPYDVVRDAGGAAVPLLNAVPTTRHRHWQLTQVPPPTSVCGCQVLAA